VAAELLVPDQRELALRLRRTAARMVQLQRHAMQQAMQRADRALLRLNAQSPQARLDLLRRRQLDLGRRLHAVFNQQQERRAARLRHAAAVLRGHHPQRQLDAMQRRLAALRGRPQAAMQRLLERDALRLRGLARSLEAVSPLATVARGYSILTRTDDGTLVRKVDQVQPGDALQARVGDGVIDVQVK
ncbi:exodeoxyribonuclease VII large subunit, partial [Pseudomonas aeruginosa]|nr:exodeoxyribonuclease VII large subunit [Pseudomonas aeruginosa]